MLGLVCANATVFEHHMSIHAHDANSVHDGVLVAQLM